MIEAGGPSTSEFQEGPIRIVVPVPPTVVMVAPPEVPRNASRAQSEGPHQVRRGPSAAFGQYRGWDHTPSFAAARESYPSRGLPQRRYKSAYRG
jgi:hypothetical protein